MNDGYDDNTEIGAMEFRLHETLHKQGVLIESTVIPKEWKCPQELRKVLLDPVWSWTSGA